MGKKGRQKRWTEGFVDRLLRPWKAERVTLTRAGKKQAPLRKGKAGKKQAAPKKPAPTTPRQRNLREIQTLMAIGKRDPERLAGIISRMLQEMNLKDEEAKLRFERLIWEKAERKGGGRESSSDADP